MMPTNDYKIECLHGLNNMQQFLYIYETRCKLVNKIKNAHERSPGVNPKTTDKV